MNSLSLTWDPYFPTLPWTSKFKSSCGRPGGNDMVTNTISMVTATCVLVPSIALLGCLDFFYIKSVTNAS